MRRTIQHKRVLNVPQNAKLVIPQTQANVTLALPEPTIPGPTTLAQHVTQLV